MRSEQNEIVRELRKQTKGELIEMMGERALYWTEMMRPGSKVNEDTTLLLYRRIHGHACEDTITLRLWQTWVAELAKIAFDEEESP